MAAHLDSALRAVLDAVSGQVAILDRSGAVVAANEAWRRFDAEAGGETTDGPVDGGRPAPGAALRGAGSHAREIAAGIEAVVRGQGPFSTHYPCRTEAGERWLHLCIARAAGTDDVQLIATREDVTARREADERLRRTEERHRAFLEHSSEAIWRFDLEPPLPVALDVDAQVEHAYRHATLTECNDATARMYGYQRGEELIGASLADLLPREDPSNVEYLRQFMAAGHRLIDAESHEPARDGSPRYFLNNLVGHVEDGHVVRVWGSQRDVTSQKLAELALRDSERKLRIALDAAGLGIWEWHRDGTRVLSESYRNVVGAAPTHHDDYLALVHPEDREGLVRRVDAAMRETGSYRYEYRVRPPGGEERWVAGFGRVVHDDAGRSDRMIGVVMDVTARRRAEILSEETRRMMQLALDVARAGVWEWQVETDRVLGDQNLARLFGIPLHDLVTGTVSVARFRAAVHADDLQHVDRALEPVMAQGGSFETEFRVRSDDDASRWVTTRGKIELDGGGKVARVTGLVFDITAQKEAERDSLLLVELAERIRTADDARELCAQVERLLGHELDGTYRVLVANGDWQADAGFVERHESLLLGAEVATLCRGELVVIPSEPHRDRRGPSARPAAGAEAREARVLVAVPRLRQQQWAFTLVGIADRPHEWSARELALLETVAERTWNALEKLRLATLLRDSEQRYRSLVTATAAIVAVTDREGRVVAPQEGWAAYTGQPWPEHGEYGYLDAVHPDDRDETARAWEAARSAGTIFEYVTRLFHRASDAYRYCAARVVPVRDGDGSIREWVSSIVDIDEQRRTEMLVRASEAEWRLVFESARDFAIFTLAPDRRVTRWNPGATRLLGYQDAEIVGRPADVLFTPEDRAAQAPEQEVATTLMVGRAEDERWHLRKDGSRFWSSGLMMPLANDHGETTGFVKIMRDRTAAKVAAEEREQLLRIAQLARAEAESASRAKDDFLATLSHELRSPLQAAMGWATLLRAGGLSAEQHDKAVRTVERSIRHEVQLVDDLLDVSRILAGKLRLDIATVDLALVMEQLRDEVQVAARAKGIELLVAIEDGATIVGDVQRVAQIFRNLLTNAIKFTQAGGRILITGDATGDRVVVAVADTGQGIAPEFLPHIFDRFSQEDPSMTRQHGGLGLGLGIVKHLVELHGGTIVAHSDGIGHGATFRVFLQRGASDGSVARLDASGQRDGDVLRDVRVGLVDDDATARDALAALLQQGGARVVTAGSAREALDLFSAARLDVVVTDLGMPEHDGFWLAHELRAAGSTIPLVALSGFAGSDVKARVRVAGFAAHVAKPAGRSELATAIAAALATAPKMRA